MGQSGSIFDESIRIISRACESRKKRIMASNIQLPESFEKENVQALQRCDSDSLELSLITENRLAENKDYEAEVLQQIQDPFSISSNSPLSSDLDREVESTWQERLVLPVNDFDGYDRAPPSCSAYETIASESMDEGLHEPIDGPDNSYTLPFSQERCGMAQARVNEISSVDVCQDTGSGELSRGSSDISPCLEWPAIQQEPSGFNELSDFIVDSCQLNKEITILLKLLDEGILPPNLSVSTGDTELSKNSLTGHINVNSDLTQQVLQPDTLSSSYSTDIGAKETWNVQPITAACNYDSEIQPCFSISNNYRFERVPIASNVDFRAMVGKPSQSLERLAYEAKLERQYRRKAKNRECSRNFRYKQRMKEECMKRGKLEKEAFLRSRLHERERLRNALVELARNCASCPKAMEFLSPYHEELGKENIPESFEGKGDSPTC